MNFLERGPRKATKAYVTYACGHKALKRSTSCIDRNCPRCTEMIKRERIQRKKELPYYLLTDSDRKEWDGRE